MIVFWICFAALAYTLAGYPLLVWLVSRLHHVAVKAAPITPPVSVIVVAHNGARALPKKIENVLASDYPKDRLQLVVASDASNDNTAEVALAYVGRGVVLVEIPERRGKHHAQLKGLNTSTGEILVFTDVGVEMDPKGIQQIVSNFADPTIGCVSSEDRVLEQGVRPSEGSYVELEMVLRRMESTIGSVVSVSGSFFAARREVCDTWHEEQSSDFFVALHALASGKRCIVDPKAIGYFGVVTSRAEFARKVRTIVHGLDVFFSHINLLNPLRYGFLSLELFSHKLLRWMIPLFLSALLISNCTLWNQGTIYRLMLCAQLGLYGIGLLTLVLSGLARLKVLRFTSFFLMGNAAAIVAWVRFFAGEKFIVWEPSSRA